MNSCARWWRCFGLRVSICTLFWLLLSPAASLAEPSEASQPGVKTPDAEGPGEVESPASGRCRGFDCVQQYVQRSDPSYAWQDTGLRLSGVDIATRVRWRGYVLNMTSQQWLSPEEVDFPLWWHLLIVVVPERLERPDWASLALEFGFTKSDGSLVRIDNRRANSWELDTIEDSITIDSTNLSDKRAELTMVAARAASVAAQTRALGAVLLNLPNAYETFEADPQHKRRAMDSLRSFAYGSFLQHRSEPERMVDLPMVKAVVKALDTITAFTSSEAVSSEPARRFGVIGASKLGLTTWMAAAADARIEAIAPLAMHAAFEDTAPPDDEAAMLSHMYPHKPGLEKMLAAAQVFSSYGEVFEVMKNEPQAYQEFAAVVDPTRWADRLQVPMLWAMSANDEVLPCTSLDAPRRHLRQFEERASFLQVANCEHGEVINCALPSIVALFRGVLLRAGRPPRLDGVLDDAADTVHLHLAGGTPPPIRVQRWDAVAATAGPAGQQQRQRPDFVASRFAAEAVHQTGPGSWNWIARSRPPVNSSASSTALFVEAAFEWPEPGFTFTVSTPVLITNSPQQARGIAGESE